LSPSGVSAGGKLADWYLDIDENSGTTYFEITGGNYSETLSENDIGPNGERLGIDFGLRIANIKAEVIAARLKSDFGKDVAVNVNQYVLPKSTLYTQTDSGVVRAIDGETGKVRWSVNVVDDGQFFVPLLTGRVERFDVENKGFNTVSFISSGSGATTSRPAVSELSMCWSNYSGTVSVAARSANKGLPGFQLNADGAIFGVPQYKDGVYYVTSIDSYIYALSEDRGSLLWENSTGFEITQAPFVVGNHVYVINDLNQLSRFDAKTGLISANWQKPRPNMGNFVGASEKKIYMVDKFGQMKVLDQESGTIVGSAAVGNVALVLPNTKNDRIYLLNNSGTIRCYREINSTKPFFHSDEFKTQKPLMKDKDAEGPGPDDPNSFEGGAEDNNNPFGGGDNDNNDPFGGGDNDNDDPFGGGDKDNNDGDASDDPDDPFGSGDEENPFG